MGFICCFLCAGLSFILLVTGIVAGVIWWVGRDERRRRRAGQTREEGWTQDTDGEWDSGRQQDPPPPQ